MKRLVLHRFFAGIFVGLILLSSSLLLAQQSGPPDGVIKEAYREILSGADKDGDGKLSMSECISISKNKSQIEKDCKYWDADGNGYITEEEYVKKVRQIMR